MITNIDLTPNIRRIIEYWETLKPFNTTDDIPEIPKVDNDLYSQYFIPKLIELGAIPKKDLIDNEIYIGNCRNATTAVWHADKNKFTYTRRKFKSVFDEDINHFEDDNGFDLFVPLIKF